VIGCIADTLTRDGFTRLFINTYFKPESLKSALGTCDAEIVNYIDESEPSGTAGGLRKILTDPQYQPMLDTTQPLIIIQGDAVTDANLSDLMEAHIANNAFITIGCQPVSDKDVDKFGIIVTDQSGQDGISGQITGFQEKPKLAEAKSRLGNTGFYVISPQAYPVIREIYGEALADAQAKALAEGKPEPKEVLFDFANDVFPRVLKRVNEGKVRGKFWAQTVEGYWSDIGNPVQYLESVHDMYAGKIDFPMPANREKFYRDGVVFWPGTQEIADSEGAELQGNVVVARPFAGQA
jgi:NDP-sugar pyrophosphorylase family protein